MLKMELGMGKKSSNANDYLSRSAIGYTSGMTEMGEIMLAGGLDL